MQIVLLEQSKLTGWLSTKLSSKHPAGGNVFQGKVICDSEKVVRPLSNGNDRTGKTGQGGVPSVSKKATTERPPDTDYEVRGWGCGDV